MEKRIRIIIASLICPLILSQLASAELIKLDFTGKIEMNYINGADPTYAFGAPISGFVLYDTSSTPLSFTSTPYNYIDYNENMQKETQISTATYQGLLFSMFFQVGTTPYLLTSESSIIEVKDNHTWNPQGGSIFYDQINVSGSGLSINFGELLGTGGTIPNMLTSANLPTSLQLPNYHSPFDIMGMSYVSDNMRLNGDIYSVLTSEMVPSSVPEPSTFILLAFALGCFAFWRKRTTL